jgi:hypothetical protein
MAKREYTVSVEITYVGGSLPTDSFERFVEAFHRNAESVLSDLRLVPSNDAFTSITASAHVRAANAIAAVTQVDSTVDRALLETGLFERFDVTGKALRVDPTHRLTEKVPEGQI